MNKIALGFTWFTSLLFSFAANSQDVPRPTDAQLKELKSIDYSPYPQQNFPNQVYFGETHLHTSFSTDAGMVGNTLGPDDAFRIARGLPFVSSMGVPGRLGRPFDLISYATELYFRATTTAVHTPSD